MFQIPGKHFFLENRGRRETQILGHFGRNLVDSKIVALRNTFVYSCHLGMLVSTFDLCLLCPARRNILRKKILEAKLGNTNKILALGPGN